MVRGPEIQTEMSLRPRLIVVSEESSNVAHDLNADRIVSPARHSDVRNFQEKYDGSRGTR